MGHYCSAWPHFLSLIRALHPLLVTLNGRNESVDFLNIESAASHIDLLIMFFFQPLPVLQPKDCLGDSEHQRQRVSSQQAGRSQARPTEATRENPAGDPTPQTLCARAQLHALCRQQRVHLPGGAGGGGAVSAGHSGER